MVGCIWPYASLVAAIYVLDCGNQYIGGCKISTHFFKMLGMGQS